MQLSNKRKFLPLSVVLALWLVAGWAHGADCYLLSAGVDNYPNVGKLNGCLNDARNTTAAFKAQRGLLFGKVQSDTLLDAQATRGAILQKFKDFSNVGKSGDVVVLFLSGHGGRTNNDQTWYFLPYDYHPNNLAATTLTDKQLLDASDVLVKQGKKVVLIIDACFSGQLHATAQSYFNRYKDPQGGGLIVMLSSSAAQTSAALGEYSAFAKAFADAMTPSGDLNHDGKITLQEIKKYSYKRTYELLKLKGMSDKQDSLVAWSPSISQNMPLASAKKIADGPVTPGTPGTGVTNWVGTEDLPGYGKLSFTMSPGGRAMMTDAKDTSEGSWHQSGNQFTLRFANDRVVYTGTLAGSKLSGTAKNGKTTWSWKVQRQ